MGLAILDIILGILILALPDLSLVTLAILFAISLLARGVFAIVTAFRLRGVPPRGAGRRRPGVMPGAAPDGMAVGAGRRVPDGLGGLLSRGGPGPAASRSRASGSTATR